MSEHWTTSDGLPVNSINAIVQSADGYIWLATFDGLVILDGDVIEHVDTHKGLPTNIVMTIEEDSKGTVWIGGDGICRIESGTNRCVTEGIDPRLQGMHIHAIYTDARGQIWTGAENGLFLFDGADWRHFSSDDGTPRSTVRVIHETADGILWMGTNGSGVFGLKDDHIFTTLTTTDGLSSDLVRSLHQDEHGVLWVGTETHGLDRIEFADTGPQINNCRQRDELFDNVIHQIIDDDRGRYWMSGNRGIFWVSKHELNAFADGEIQRVRSTSYTERNGMRNREAKVAEQAQPLDDLDKAKSAFFANISHELRTPLTLILGPLADATQGDRSILDHQLAPMHRNANRLLGLIDQLLDLQRAEGMGIGLALSRDLVELHVGRIEVASREGEGSCFTVMLPRGSESLPQQSPLTLTPQSPVFGIPDIADSPSSAHNPEETLGNEADERPIVLVVVDNQDVLAYITDVLHTRFRILRATDGHEALLVARRSPPDVIVSDVTMPRMDGLTLSRRLAEDETLGGVPVVLLTARTTDDDEVAGLRSGALVYLKKPFSASVLLEQIETLLVNTRRLRQQIRQDERRRAVPTTEIATVETLLEHIRKTAERLIFEDDLDVDLLAHELGLSRSHLYRSLQKEAGVNPSDVLREVLLVRAAELLSNQRGSISEIASAVGFGSLDVFSHAFRRHFGVRPAEWRGTL